MCKWSKISSLVSIPKRQLTGTGFTCRCRQRHWKHNKSCAGLTEQWVGKCTRKSLSVRINCLLMYWLVSVTNHSLNIPFFLNSTLLLAILYGSKAVRAKIRPNSVNLFFDWSFKSHFTRGHKQTVFHSYYLINHVTKFSPSLTFLIPTYYALQPISIVHFIKPLIDALRKATCWWFSAYKK